MNKQIGEKVDLFMSGLMGRFAENREFFIEITAAFLSGSKRYELRAVREEALLAFYHNGAAYCLTADAFRAFTKSRFLFMTVCCLFIGNAEKTSGSVRIKKV